MKKEIILLMMILTIIVGGCTQNDTNGKSENSQDLSQIQGMSCADCSGSAKIEVEKIEIYHFHGNSQCVSCITMGNLAEETVNTYFADELKSGKIVFAHINAELSENAQLAKKYKVTGSSLWIGVYTTNGQFRAEENINVWYKLRDKAGYMSYLKGVIDKRLAGDMS
jgi:hypothetical protein